MKVNMVSGFTPCIQSTSVFVFQRMLDVQCFFRLYAQRAIVFLGTLAQLL